MSFIVSLLGTRLKVHKTAVLGDIWIVPENYAQGAPMASGVLALDEDHARRLVACWNALMYAPTDQVEAYGDAVCGTITTIGKGHIALAAERNQLLAERDAALALQPQLVDALSRLLATVLLCEAPGGKKVETLANVAHARDVLAAAGAA